MPLGRTETASQIFMTATYQKLAREFSKNIRRAFVCPIPLAPHSAGFPCVVGVCRCNKCSPLSVFYRLVSSAPVLLLNKVCRRNLARCYIPGFVFIALRGVSELPKLRVLCNKSNTFFVTGRVWLGKCFF